MPFRTPTPQFKHRISDSQLVKSSEETMILKIVRSNYSNLNIVALLLPFNGSLKMLKSSLSCLWFLGWSHCPEYYPEYLSWIYIKHLYKMSTKELYLCNEIFPRIIQEILFFSHQKQICKGKSSREREGEREKLYRKGIKQHPMF